MEADLSALPPSLRERLRTPGCAQPLPPRAGSTVVYLLRTCYRATTNPALEVALRVAAALDVPLLCLAVLEDSFPPSMREAHALAPPRRPTDRATAFRLEALRELQPDFAARGTTLLVHVERDGCRPAVIMSLAAKARLVISDEHYGVEPHATAVARAAQTGAPVWLCDTSCTVPSVVLTNAALNGGNAGFLRATATARSKRLADNWFDFAPAPPPPRAPPTPPPSWSIDLSTGQSDDTSLDAVLSAPSRRDSSVARVRHTRGGPRAAAARWAAFVRGDGLRSYANHRNNPLAVEGKGASRMSAYVNTGMIDPYQLARDASAAKADKYLAEFVGFRESAYLWCLLHPGGDARCPLQPYRWPVARACQCSPRRPSPLPTGGYALAATAVPGWAKDQMRRYCADHVFPPHGPHTLPQPLPQLTLEALEAGRSRDPYWDDCQRCLAMSGELHNNVRMAWGKAVVPWHAVALRAASAASATAAAAAAATSATAIAADAAADAASPSSSSSATVPPLPSSSERLQAALDLLIRLNDKFALDGGAPPSYGGVLWCLGWRDRPGEDGCPTRRPTSVMAKRISPGDLERRAIWRCGGVRPKGFATSAHASSVSSETGRISYASSVSSAIASSSHASSVSSAIASSSRASDAEQTPAQREVMTDSSSHASSVSSTPAQREVMMAGAPAPPAKRARDGANASAAAAPGAKRPMSTVQPGSGSRGPLGQGQGTLFSHWGHRESSAALAAPSATGSVTDAGAGDTANDVGDIASRGTNH